MGGASQSVKEDMYIPRVYRQQRGFILKESVILMISKLFLGLFLLVVPVRAHQSYGKLDANYGSSNYYLNSETPTLNQQDESNVNLNMNNDVNVHRKETALTDFEILSMLYHSTNGPSSWSTTYLDGWMTGDPCTGPWNGVTCTSGSVDYMVRQYVNMVGTIPSEMGQLSRLTYFNLYSNGLYGTVPSELGQLTSMTQMFGLYGNSFSGSIPSELGRLSMMLEDFIIGPNSLTGVIPSELGQLTGITAYFYLASNSLCGEIPVEVSALNVENGGPVANQYNIELENSLGTACCSANPVVNVTCAPSLSPTISFNPTMETDPPTPAPSIPSPLPTLSPSSNPTPVPTSKPSSLPTPSPSPNPTPVPTVICSAGTMYDGVNCIDCSIGRYSNFSHAPYPPNCTLCPSGQYNTDTGLSECTHCADGKVSSSDRTFCKDCSGTSYSSHIL